MTTKHPVSYMQPRVRGGSTKPAAPRPGCRVKNWIVIGLSFLTGNTPPRSLARNFGDLPQRGLCRGLWRIECTAEPMRKLLSIGLFIFLAGTASAQAPAQNGFKRIEDVVYGRKFGTALTLDVFQPEKPNGCGILFMVSGGFFSSHDAINPGFYRALLEHGYPVFAVVHGSQPRFIIPEIE